MIMIASMYTGCSLILLAKDGVYLHEPRDVDGLEFNPSSRAEIALKCSNSTQISNRLTGETIATISVNQTFVQAQEVNINVSRWEWSRPLYLQDLRNHAVNTSWTVFPGSGNLINGRRFSGFDVSQSLYTAVVNSVSQYFVHEKAT